MNTRRSQKHTLTVVLVVLVVLDVWGIAEFPLTIARNWDRAKAGFVVSAGGAAIVLGLMIWLTIRLAKRVRRS
jgi:hypothetical protein